MAVTSHDLADFSRFAEGELSVGNAKSMEQLAREWSAKRELAKLVNDIAESEADIEAGRVHTAEQAFAEVRQKLGLSQ